MSKPLHKFRLDNQHRIYLDGKMIKGVQALQITLDAKNPSVAIVNMVMITCPPELETNVADITVLTPKKEEAAAEVSASSEVPAEVVAEVKP